MIGPVVVIVLFFVLFFTMLHLQKVSRAERKTANAAAGATPSKKTKAVDVIVGATPGKVMKVAAAIATLVLVAAVVIFKPWPTTWDTVTEGRLGVWSTGVWVWSHWAFVLILLVLLYAGTWFVTKIPTRFGLRDAIVKTGTFLFFIVPFVGYFYDKPVTTQTYVPTITYPSVPTSNWPVVHRLLTPYERTQNIMVPVTYPAQEVHLVINGANWTLHNVYRNNMECERSWKDSIRTCPENNGVKWWYITNAIDQNNPISYTFALGPEY